MLVDENVVQEFEKVIAFFIKKKLNTNKKGNLRVSLCFLKYFFFIKLFKLNHSYQNCIRLKLLYIVTLIELL